MNKGRASLWSTFSHEVSNFFIKTRLSKISFGLPQMWLWVLFWHSQAIHMAPALSTLVCMDDRTLSIGSIPVLWSLKPDPPSEALVVLVGLLGMNTWQKNTWKKKYSFRQLQFAASASSILIAWHNLLASVTISYNELRWSLRQLLFLYLPRYGISVFKHVSITNLILNPSLSWT